MVIILDSTYVKAYLEQVDANATHLNSKDRTQILGLFKDFEDFFDVTLGYWDTDPIEPDLQPNSKLFSCEYYPVPSINEETFCKEI